MDTQQLITQFPRLYHLTAFGGAQGILRHGLLSTSRLLDLFEVYGERRRRLETQQRLETTRLVHPRHGTALLRDQKPLSERALARCLEPGISPPDWYRLLNNKTFFWLSRRRLEKLLNARANRELRHAILIIDTAKLVDRYEPVIELAPINTGNAQRRARPRGSRTFLPIGDYPYRDWRKKRPAWDAVVELTIAEAVEDIADFVIAIEHG